MSCGRREAEISANAALGALDTENKSAPRSVLTAPAALFAGDLSAVSRQLCARSLQSDLFYLIRHGVL
jgi:hypothetical protein